MSDESATPAREGSSRCSEIAVVVLLITHNSSLITHHFLPQGRSIDLTHSRVVSHLVCWIAFAGSTPLGQTTEHSPTNVHSQMPSDLASAASRAGFPSSRESR